MHSTARTTTSTPSTSSPPTSTSVATTPGALARCRTAQLHVTFGPLGAGAGNRYVRLILSNSGASCRTRGYVGLQLLGPGGQLVPTDVVRDSAAPAAPLVVATGAEASALLHWGAIPAGNEPQSGPCEPVPQQVEVTPPNDFQFTVAPWAFGAVCERGRINAGPLQAGVPSP